MTCYSYRHDRDGQVFNLAVRRILSKFKKMKTSLLLFVMFVLSAPSFAQKDVTGQATNLNTSRSNFYRLVYPPNFLTGDDAARMLDELDKTPMDATQLKMWLPANFKRFGLKPERVKQISIYAYKEHPDCNACEKDCSGKCVQDSEGVCVCISSGPSSDSREKRPVSVILLLDKVIGDDGTIDLVGLTYKRATTVKSGKSNSSD